MIRLTNMHNMSFFSIKMHWKSNLQWSIITENIQLFQLRLYTSEAEKSNTSAKGCWDLNLGIANKLMNFQSDSQKPFVLVFDFSALLVDNLN
jgi:lipopolysaccharide assembly outer membrane protein LptD (OstA)